MNKLKELVDDLERQRKEDSKVKVRRGLPIARQAGRGGG